MGIRLLPVRGRGTAASNGSTGSHISLRAYSMLKGDFQELAQVGVLTNNPSLGESYRGDGRRYLSEEHFGTREATNDLLMAAQVKVRQNERDNTTTKYQTRR